MLKSSRFSFWGNKKNNPSAKELRASYNSILWILKFQIIKIHNHSENHSFLSWHTSRKELHWNQVTAFKMRAQNYLSIYKEVKAQLSIRTSCSLEQDAIPLESSHCGIKIRIKLHERNVFLPFFTAPRFLCSYLMVIVTSISLSVTIEPRTWCRTAVSVSILGEDL